MSPKYSLLCFVLPALLALESSPVLGVTILDESIMASEPAGDNVAEPDWNLYFQQKHPEDPIPAAFLEEYELTTRFGFGNTLAHLAVIRNDLALFLAYLDKGGTVAGFNDEGNSVLFLLAQYDRKELFEALAQKQGLYTKKGKAYTALLKVASKQNNKGQTILMAPYSSALSDRRDTEYWLREYSDLFSVPVSTTDKQGLTVEQYIPSSKAPDQAILQALKATKKRPSSLYSSRPT